MKCPYCEETYTLGVTGVVQGCDVCMGIIRNPLDNTIIEWEAMLTDEEVDQMTDMEKS